MRVKQVFHCSKFLLGIDHGFDTVVHVLGKIDLVAAQSTQVRDIKDSVVSLGVLAVGATDLHVVLVCDGLELIFVFRKLGQFDVHGSTHASTAVGWARCDVAQMLVVGKSGLLFNLCSSDRETLEDLADVGALLHGDDTELVLLVHPDEECLVVVVEDTTRLWPFTLKTTRFKILVATLEKEVVSNQLIALLIGHCGQ